MDSHFSTWNLVHTQWLAAHQTGTMRLSDSEQTGYTSGRDSENHKHLQFDPKLHRYSLNMLEWDKNLKNQYVKQYLLLLTTRVLLQTTSEGLAVNTVAI